MTDIPEDIMKTARDVAGVIHGVTFSRGCTAGGITDIASALYAERIAAAEAERKRCAEIARAPYSASGQFDHSYAGNAIVAAILGGLT